MPRTYTLEKIEAELVEKNRLERAWELFASKLDPWRSQPEEPIKTHSITVTRLPIAHFYVDVKGRVHYFGGK